MELARSRPRFFATLALLLGGCLLVLAGATLPAVAARWVGFGLGLAAVLVSLALLSEAVHGRAAGAVRPLPVLAAATVLGTSCQTILALTLSPGPAKWVTFGDGWLLCVLAVAALVAHELSTNRVVHFIEVVKRPAGREPDGATG